MSRQMVVQLYVLGPVTVDVWTGLLSVVDMGDFLHFCRLYFMHPSPICLTRVSKTIFGRLGFVIVFAISIPAYDVSHSHQSLEVPDSMINKVLTNCIRILGILCLSFVPLAVNVFVAPFRSFIGAYSAGYPIYTDDFSMQSFMMGATSVPTCIILYGSNRQGWRFQ